MVKSALIVSAWAEYEHDDSLLAVKLSTAGILFLGTPHRGSNDASWRALLEELVALHPESRKQLEIHNSDSVWLGLWLEQFKSVQLGFSNYYIYGTEPCEYQDLPMPV